MLTHSRAGVWLGARENLHEVGGAPFFSGVHEGNEMGVHSSADAVVMTSVE